uniref:Uncharacterized protein n=1 Tax=Glossina austeni TaxID=7395 RepID=A0A1A9UKR9_GLOAU
MKKKNWKTTSHCENMSLDRCADEYDKFDSESIQLGEYEESASEEFSDFIYPIQRQQIEKVPLSQENPDCRFLDNFHALYDAVVVVVFIPLKWQMPTRTKEIDKRTGRLQLHFAE